MIDFSSFASQKQIFKGLDESLALFEKGVTLSKELSKRLEDAKTKVEALSKEGGKLVKKPFAGEND